MIDQRAIEAIEYSDTDELIRVVDGYCASATWDALLELRSRCQEAVTRGKQVWGVEEHIRYRLALEAPAIYAGPVVSEGRARFALGPLPEVAASTKSWNEMEPYLEPGPATDTFAAERVVRGETVTDVIPDLPGSLLPWEPAYAVATYKGDKVETPSPDLPVRGHTELEGHGEPIDDPHSTGALADLVEPWTDQSNGRCQTAAVSGSHLEAIGVLGLSSAGIGEMNFPLALAWMAWAGASGGAHGRRRGSAAGRYSAWWTIAALADLDWPPDPAQIAAAAGQMRWFWFDDGSPEVGWFLRIAVWDSESDLAWAISAADLADQ